MAAPIGLGIPLSRLRGIASGCRRLASARREKPVSILKAILAMLLVFGVAGASQAETYDVVILNGRVMDPETSFDAIRNVGVKNGKIVTITKDAIKGNETIDATGLVCLQVS
jgi:hypothetical protein